MTESKTDSTMLYLSRSDVRSALSRIDPVAIVAQALRIHAEGGTVLPDESYLTWTNLDGGDAAGQGQAVAVVLDVDARRR